MDMESSLDLSYLFGVLKKHLLSVILAGLLAGAIGFSVSYFLIPKKYESRAMLYIENNKQVSEAVNINDINAAQKLVNTCQIIFKSSTMMDRLIVNLDLPYTKEQLDKMITATSVNATEVMELVVESSDPLEAQRIVNELVQLSAEEFLRVVKSGSIEIIDMGEVNTSPSFPNTPLIAAVCLVLGAAAFYVIVLIRDMLDVVVKADDNIAQMYDVPVFAEIEDSEVISDSKYGYYSNYGYGSKSAPAKKSEEIAAPAGTFSPKLISDSTPFVITEAYNTARTNLMFAVSTFQYKIIAVTSSNPSEGKSTVCANLAISFANAGFKVLLVECDLRKPTVSKNFGIKAKKGLSSILGGFCAISDAIVRDVISGLDIITAGDIPPNPSELLGSGVMKGFLTASSESYDYIFLDTPPVNVVTDSQLMNDLIAGMVFIVKQDSTTHPDVQSALEKIRLANGKTLGFIRSFCRNGKSGKYGKKYSYKYKYGYSEKSSSEN